MILYRKVVFLKLAYLHHGNQVGNRIFLPMLDLRTSEYWTTSREMRQHNSTNRNSIFITSIGECARFQPNTDDPAELWDTNFGQAHTGQAQARVATEKVQVNEAEEDPHFIITHRESTVDKFLKATDAPQYKNVADQELIRKQEESKAISMAFKAYRFGGEQEEDWEKHITDLETLAFDYQIRSKDLAYFVRLTVREKALPVHRAEFPDMAKIKRDILYALGIKGTDEDESSCEESTSGISSLSDGENDKRINYGGQCMYGRPSFPIQKISKWFKAERF